MASAASFLARCSGDRARNANEAAPLLGAEAPSLWIERLHEIVELDEACISSFGEALLPGLKVIG